MSGAWMATAASSGAPSVLLRVMKPFHMMCKYHGLTPFKINPTGRTLKRSASDIIYAALLSLIHFAVLAYGIVYMNERGVGSEKSGKLDILRKVVNLSLYAVSGTAALLDMTINAKTYRKIISLISRCDEMLFKSRWINKPSTELLVKGEIVAVVVIEAGTVVYLSTTGKSAVDIFYDVAASWCTAVLWMATLKFINLVLLVNNGLAYINELLPTYKAHGDGVDFAADGGPKRSPTGGGGHVAWNELVKGKINTGFQSRAASIRSLRRAYDALSELSEYSVSAHQLAIVLSLLASLVNTIVLTYDVASSPEGTSGPIGLAGWLWFATSMAHNVLLFLVLVVPPHAAAEEGCRSAKVISQMLLDEPLRSQAEAELRLFAHQVARNRPTFCVFGAVTLDLNLLASFISTLTTYTVLLLTFKK